MLRSIILVAVGGAFGCVFRYLAGLGISRWGTLVFPLGTFAVNLLGCFLIGIFYALSERFHWFSPDWRLLLVTGLCGGFTTFSTFAFENVKLLQDGNYLHGLLYMVLSVILGLTAVVAGIYVAK